MKKVFFLSIIFFFALALAGFNPVKADSVIVNGSYTDTDTLSQADYDDLQNTALLLKYLQNGGVIDTSNVSAGYSASDLVSDFGNFVREVVPDLIDVINPFQSKFEYTPLGNAMLNNNIYKFMGLLPFQALSQEGDDNNQPVVPSHYEDLINLINGSGFYWQDWTPTYNNNVLQPLVPTNVKQMTWVKSGNYVITQSSYPSPIVTITINGSQNDGYTVNISNYSNSSYTDCGNNNRIMYNTQPANEPYLNSQNVFSAYYGMNYYSATSITNSLNNGINQGQDYLYNALSNISMFFRNVNIYVNGDLWAQAFQTPTYSLQIYNDTVSPVATNDYGYVHWVYDYEIFFRIDHIWDILQDILDNMDNNNPSTQIIRWDNLDDVIVDVDGQPAVAVKIYTPESTIDEDYLSIYGPIIPVFVPLFTPVIDDSDIVLIAETPMSAIPNDLLDVFAYIFIGSLFVCFIHRLLE